MLPTTMTTLPIPASWNVLIPEAPLAAQVEPGVQAPLDERLLEDAFSAFREVAGSLELSYRKLQDEVERLRRELSKRNRELEETQAKLRREECLAEVSTLLAHEIRNPLASLELFAGLLAESVLVAEHRDWVEQMQAGLRTLAATVNNVLHFHSIPEGEKTPVNLGDVLDWVRNFLAPLAKQCQIIVSLQNRLGGVQLPADRHRLEQVFLNLVLNSVRAMPDGGWIELAGRQEASGEIVLTVSDTGPGIPPGELERIFKPGFSRREGSPGLGLAVCRKIVGQHEGTIAADNRSAGGAVFTITFPATNCFREGKNW